MPSDAFILIGETRAYEKQADSGNRVSRNFCPVCGSFVFATNSGYPGMTFLKVGTLDDPEVFTPQMIVFASRAPSWVRFDDALPTFPEMPPKQDRQKVTA